MKNASLRVQVDRNDLGGLAPGYKGADYPPVFPCSKLKLDQLFLHWLSLPESQELVSNLIEDAKAGKPIKGPSPYPGPTPLSPTTAHALFSSTPPLSPQKVRSPRSPASPLRRSNTSTVFRRAAVATIPQFYFPQGAAIPEDSKTEWLRQVDSYFAQHGSQSMHGKQFVEMLQELSEIPCMVGYTLFKRLLQPNTVEVTKESFVRWWLSHSMVAAQPVRRVFEILRQEGQEYLTYASFAPLMEAILEHHPGLEFLQETAEFQKKYSETVVYRIFYSLNKSGSGRMTFREFKRGDLLDALYMLDREEDINKVLKYFSYEHFYVIYCKFWELDTDHDFYIDKNDLAHYSQCALSFQIIDRIFEQVPRKFTSKIPGKMGYEDFVWFILSEEDKTSDTALEYWFRCCDLDSDGCIRPREMWYFYEEQLKRLEGLSQEPVLFEDVVCQLHDMLLPAEEGAYTLQDLKRTKPLSGLLFNALFNLHKFLSFENRDPFAMRAEQGEFAGLTEWDKFARIEYYRLASEDDQEEAGVEPEDGMWADVDAAMMDRVH